MANFEVFQCNVCNRQTEKVIDQTHATLNKCNITYKCTGTLNKVSSSDTKTITSPASVPNLTNWVPRGQKTIQQQVVTPTQILLNSAYDVLAIAVESSSVLNIHEIDMVLEIRQLINASYNEYFYSKPSNTSLISGQDDSSKRLTLRFVNGANPDAIVVYVNGVEVDPSTYDRSVPGRIVFNSVLTSQTNQVRVLVYQETQPNYVTLKFIRNDATSLLNSSGSAWDNVTSVMMPDMVSYSVFTCTDVSALLINSQMEVISVTGNTAYWLLADAPYSEYDRDTFNSVSINSLVANKTVIEFKNDSLNSPKFFIDSLVVQSLFPPIRITSKLADDVIPTTVNSINTKIQNLYIT